MTFCSFVCKILQHFLMASFFGPISPLLPFFPNPFLWDQDSTSESVGRCFVFFWVDSSYILSRREGRHFECQDIFFHLPDNPACVQLWLAKSDTLLVQILVFDPDTKRRNIYTHTHLPSSLSHSFIHILFLSSALLHEHLCTPTLEFITSVYITLYVKLED